MAQVVSRRPLTAETQVNKNGICGGQDRTDACGQAVIWLPFASILLNILKVQLISDLFRAPVLSWRPSGSCPAGPGGGQSGTGTGFYPSSSALPCRYHFTTAHHTLISPGG
jgi:hypothetical protein